MCKKSSLYITNSYLCGLLTNSSSFCAMPNSKATTLSQSQTRWQPPQQRIPEARLPNTARWQHYRIVKEGDSHFSKVFGCKTNNWKTLSSSFTCRTQQQVDNTVPKSNKVTATLAKNFGGMTNHWKTCQGPCHLVSLHDMIYFGACMGTVRYHLSLHALCMQRNSLLLMGPRGAPTICHNQPGASRNYSFGQIWADREQIFVLIPMWFLHILAFLAGIQRARVIYPT